MRKLWPLVVLLVAVLIVPNAVMAATGSFSSTTSTPALKAANSGSGRAITASAARTHGAYITSNASFGTFHGVYGATRSASTNASGVLGFATASFGQTNGVWGRTTSPDGIGVFGDGGTGVLGTGDVGVVGFGPAFGVLSLGTLGVVGGPIVADGSVSGANMASDVAGTCTVLQAASTAQCSFISGFPQGVVPVVVVTPTGNPGGNFWVSGISGTGFSINMSSPASVGGLTFNYIVVGSVPGSAAAIAASASRDPRAQVARAVAATRR
jgi:hypothetical protein